jgi:F-type H+-transporting ATPase subunit alpha
MEVGFVKSSRDFVVYLEGLPSAKINDLVENEEGIRGWINSLLSDKVEVLMLNETPVFPGELFKNTGKKLTLPVGNFLMGRAINPLGVPIDGKGKLPKSETWLELDRIAPGINSREFITRQFDTGLTLIDTLIPIGRGQRELVLGDARSGKADFLVDIMFSQRQTKTICIYAAIGKPLAEIGKLITTLASNQILPYSVVVATASADPAPLIFLTPQTAFTIAEYFQRKGWDVLVILDDMGIHAKIYREISLLCNRSPGRDSYPGDIFYQQSHLLERAGNFKKEMGGGSVTALPVIEINLGDFTTYIPTNLMSMTDGHLLFKSTLYNQGQRPAIDISLSV